MSAIISIGTATPAYKYKQQDILSFLQKNYASSKVTQRQLSAISNKSGIENRYSAIPDFNLEPGSNLLFDSFETPDIKKRIDIFKQEALPLSLKSITACFEKTDLRVNDITHLITVSCTGISAPGIDLELIQKLGLKSDITRFSVNFMGCFAAFHGLKLADIICKANDKAKVLIVCVELCSLHLQKNKSPDNLLSNTLFGDGAATVLVCSKQLAQSLKIPHIESSNFHSDIEFNGKSDMAWEISSLGFSMTLSSNISGLIEKNIQGLFLKACSNLKLKKEDFSGWAIHPGGKKILESCEKGLSIEKNDLLNSYKILREYGNMSSPTILFVLNDIWENTLKKSHNKWIFASAFGPGLTMESGIFKTINRI